MKTTKHYKTKKGIIAIDIENGEIVEVAHLHEQNAEGFFNWEELKPLKKSDNHLGFCLI